MHVLKLLCNNHGEKRKYTRKYANCGDREKEKYTKNTPIVVTEKENTKKYANCGEREKKLPQCLVRGFDSLPR